MGPESTACTLWLTGLSGAGKSTLAAALTAALATAGRACLPLDGDRLREGLCGDLGFTPTDRSENLRRAAEVARLANEAGLVVVASFIAPLRQDRARVAGIVGRGFREVFVDAPLAVCEQRDPKGLYRRVRRGELRGFTGIDAPYEPPVSPALHLSTHRENPQACLERLLALVSGVPADGWPTDSEAGGRGRPCRPPPTGICAAG